MFAALLDRHRGGCFRVRPAGRFRTRRRYLDDSNVLETRFESADGVATVTDCLTMLPHAEEPDVLTPQTELLRCIEIHEGAAVLELEYQPRPDFGRTAVRLQRRSDRTFVLRDQERYLVWRAPAAGGSSGRTSAWPTRRSARAGTLRGAVAPPRGFRPCWLSW